MSYISRAVRNVELLLYNTKPFSRRNREVVRKISRTRYWINEDRVEVLPLEGERGRDNE